MPAIHRYVLLDVFTDTPLTGNQLAVFPEGDGLAGEAMQQLARELRLAETVFVLAPSEGGDARIRIFTPSLELPFAGHPTLGAAVVVCVERGAGAAVLETGAGPVRVSVRLDGPRRGSGWMEQPIPSWAPFGRSRELLTALGVKRSSGPVEQYVNGPTHVLVELSSGGEVAALAPDLQALAALGELCVSCFSADGVGWKTRMFAPALGVAEDSATGSAAGPIAVHLARHGRIDFDREVELRQGAELERPSLLRARVIGSRAAIESVQVGGEAVIVAAGEFTL